MKKIYINPATKIVKIASKSQMLTTSPELGGTYGGGEILSRENDWDDDDE